MDAGTAPLILALWRRGFHTVSSCEEIVPAHAYVAFATLAEARRFQRFTRGRLIVPTAQDYAGCSRNRYNVPGAVGVMFPTDAIAAVAARLTNKAVRHANGRGGKASATTRHVADRMKIRSRIHSSENRPGGALRLGTGRASALQS